MGTEVEKIYKEFTSIKDIIDDKIANNNQERSFYVVDIYDIYKKHQIWKEMLPRVKPYYAVKCNDLKEITAFIATFDDMGFDCASKNEIDQVLSQGVDPSRIIYANPCKTKSYIRHAKNNGIDLMTFDNEFELHKVAQLHPRAKLVVRIKGDEKTSKCKFNIKFGVDVEQCYNLLKKAKQLDLNVVGVSFHNGSYCSDAAAYMKSIAAARLVFDMGEEIGHKMTVLDIGGGFPGDDRAKVPFEALALGVNKALDMYFPPKPDLQIIAEPGRYYVASAMSLCCMVIAKRIELDSDTGKTVHMSYFNDGVYSAFSGVLYEGANPDVILAKEETRSERPIYQSVFWGPTCDGLDCIKRDFQFPEVHIGDWLVFINMGAYTNCVASNFNGMDKATVIIADRMSNGPGSYFNRLNNNYANYNSVDWTKVGGNKNNEIRFLNSEADSRKSEIKYEIKTNGKI